MRLLSRCLALSLLVYAPLALSDHLQPPDTVNAIVMAAGVQLSWTDSENATNYRVYRNGLEIVVNLVDSQHLDADVIPETAYGYFILGCDEFGECSEASSPAVHVTTNAVIEECPVVGGSTGHDIAQNVTITIEGLPNPILSWIPPENSVRWNVYRNDLYEFTVVNGIPQYEIQNFVEGDTFYVTSIFADETIGPASALATLPPVDCAVVQAELSQLQLDHQAFIEFSAALLEDFDALTIEHADLHTANDATLLELQGTQVALTQCEADLVTATDLLTTTQADALAAIAAAETAQANAEAAQATAEAGEAQALTDLAAALGDLALVQQELLDTMLLLDTANQTIADQSLTIFNLQADLAACQAQLP